MLVVPSAGVHREIERARARTSVSPGHERERADAAPQVVSGLWAEVLRAAGELGIATAGGEGYAPRVYRRVYARALRRRKVDVLALDEMLPTGGRSAHDIGFWAKRLQPSRGHAEELVEQVAGVHRNPTELDEQMAAGSCRDDVAGRGGMHSATLEVVGLNHPAEMIIRFIISAILLRH